MQGDGEERKRVVVVPGVVCRGYGIASGVARNSPYPNGSIPLQIPHFQRLGLDLSGLHGATVNVSIRPRRFQLSRPRFTFRSVEWVAGFPPEDFSFSPCRIRFGAGVYRGWVYYPHPETKQRHHHDPTTLEIIASYIPGIGTGDDVELELLADEIIVSDG
jgi:hypothetical protein